MSETLLGDLRMHSLFKHQGSVGMPEIMKTYFWNVSFFQQAVIGADQISW